MAFHHLPHCHRLRRAGLARDLPVQTAQLARLPAHKEGQGAERRVQQGTSPLLFLLFRAKARLRGVRDLSQQEQAQVRAVGRNLQHLHRLPHRVLLLMEQ